MFRSERPSQAIITKILKKGGNVVHNKLDETI